MNQEATTDNAMTYENNPGLGRILALGIQPIPTPPKMMIAVPSGEHICMMPDGQVSVFFEGIYDVCECSGVAVPQVPEGSRLIAGLHRDEESVSVYQDFEGFFYTHRASAGVTQLRAEDTEANQEKSCAKMHRDFFDMPKNPDRQVPIRPAKTDKPKK